MRLLRFILNFLPFRTKQIKLDVAWSVRKSMRYPVERI